MKILILVLLLGSSVFLKAQDLPQLEGKNLVYNSEVVYLNRGENGISIGLRKSAARFLLSRSQKSYQSNADLLETSYRSKATVQVRINAKTLEVISVSRSTDPQFGRGL